MCVKHLTLLSSISETLYANMYALYTYSANTDGKPMDFVREKYSFPDRKKKSHFSWFHQAFFGEV